MISDELIWSQKYRPRKVEQAILPDEIKDVLITFVKQQSIPNLLLCGKAGTGKTTAAKAILEELGCDYIVINGSMNGNIDTLRNDIKQFASSVSLSGGRKYVILDEADYLNPNSTQPALRNFMEEYSKNCGFILTCNFKNRIIEPLHSRCSVIEFTIPKEQRQKLASQFFNRVVKILESENVKFDQKVVAEVITKHFPDYRRTLNELQRYSATGSIDSGILSNFKEDNVKTLIKLMKEKNFTEVRKWVGENADMDSTSFFRTLYDTSYDFLKTSSVPQLVLILGSYQYKAAFVADAEINIMACLTEIMIEVEFK